MNVVSFCIFVDEKENVLFFYSFVLLSFEKD